MSIGRATYLSTFTELVLSLTFAIVDAVNGDGRIARDYREEGL